MLDPTLSPLNLHSIASNHALLTDDRLSEIAAHPMAWPKLVTWANYLLQLPHEDRPSIPVPRPPENFDPSTTPATVTSAAPAEIPQAPLPRTKKNRAPLFILLLALAVAAGVGWTVIPSQSSQPAPTTAPAREEASTPPSERVPADDPSLTASGAGFTCTARQTVVTCWGQNTYGQLGTGMASEDHYYSFEVDEPVLRLVAGADFACASSATSVTCWGDNRWKQAGDSDIRILPPTTLPALSPIDGLTAGNIHACVLSEGNIVCWGSDYSGQLGSGAQGEQGAGLTEIALPAGQIPQDIYASGFTTCAHTEADLVCWGANDEGRINDTDKRILPPTVVHRDASW